MPPRLPRRTVRDRGDTRGGYLMIEALATLAIGAMILAALASLSGLLLRSVDRAGERARAVEVVGRTVAALRRDIAPALRLRWGQPAATAAEDGGEGEVEAGLGAYVFSGTATRLILARPVAGADGLAVPVLTVFEVDERTPRRRLLTAEGAIPPQAAGPGAVALGPVAEAYAGPLGFRFRYEGRGADGAPLAGERWEATDAMPSVVIVEVVDADGAPAFPPVRIPLLRDADPACIAADRGGCALRSPSIAAAAPAEPVPPPGRRPEGRR